MKTFKHKTSPVLATLTEKTVWMSDLEGNIYKQFPIQHLLLDQFEDETIEFPGNFELAKIVFRKKQDGKRAEKAREAEERRRIAEENRRRELLNLWNIRKALNAGQPVYGVQVELYEYNGEDSEQVEIVENYPMYFADKAEYEKALAEARSLTRYHGEQHNISYGKLNDTVTWQKFMDDDYNFFDYVDNYNDEWRDYDYPAIDDDAIIVEWAWQKYVGYCRKLIDVRPAWAYDIKTEKDIITGNEERTYRYNYSLLLSADEVKEYRHGTKYDAAVAEKIADALNEGNWKWDRFGYFTADKVKDIFDFYLIPEEEDEED